MKVLGGVGKEVLYLDYDGVLHPEGVYRDRHRGKYLGDEYAGHHLFENSNLLRELLEPYPGVRIVLSTTWVRILGFTRARSYLVPELAERVVGATYHSAMQRGVFAQLTRPQQVLADVTRRCPSTWLAIDDITDGWPDKNLPNFVATDPRYGCAEPSVIAELKARMAVKYRSRG
ncbi:HAD domain-containing protein [Aquabacterium sp.]|uniref:HAD domain-containing protein n=1 Tax=Aquabacterium sp. TaxID=1872578 RepID=UPI002489B7A0|nr:HAD domain-containing protein [Aquabacterium sp.]MDI1258258.1 HAD domain-containing protein [Aquabacterium sp.]